VFLKQVYTAKVKFTLQSPKHAHVTLVARSHHAVAQVRQHVPEYAAVAVEEVAAIVRLFQLVPTCRSKR
jgi:hypothetical protein